MLFNIYFLIFINMRTFEEILIKFNNIHENKYDYSLAVYKDRLSKIRIICKEHGEFNQTTSAHLSGQGCPECGKIKQHQSKKITFVEFLRRANKKHKNKFTYDEDTYNGIKSPCKIYCPIHGETIQVPKNHLKGGGCYKCSKIESGKKNTYSKEQFVNKANQVHNNKYEYNNVVYRLITIPIIITCKMHGDFKQKPSNHLVGQGCPKCGNVARLNTDDFIKRSQLTHGDKYDYSLTEYISSKYKVKIICDKHGEFMQSPAAHMSGNGCPNCNESKGEKLIAKILKEKKVIFVRQKKFIDCKNKAVLPFDFYLPNLHLCIEFNGAQHYNFVEYFHKNKEKFKEQQKRDKIKTEFCKKNSIPFLRIKYNENVKNKINTFLNENKPKNKTAN